MKKLTFDEQSLTNSNLQEMFGHCLFPEILNKVALLWPKLSTSEPRVSPEESAGRFIWRTDIEYLVAAMINYGDSASLMFEGFCFIFDFCLFFEPDYTHSLYYGFLNDFNVFLETSSWIYERYKTLCYVDHL